MIKKVLIANRGEIVCRIARTAKRMGIKTVAVYSDADANGLHVRACDEAVHIGGSPATESYLRIDRIIAAAASSGCDALHPGYGFLSENPDLPEACAAAGLVFIGPTAAAMRALGGKAAAKEIAIKAQVPVVPGYQGPEQDVRTLAREAAKIGYPVMIKAVAGGGGRGMRLVESAAQLPEMLESAQREAQSAFGNATVLVEKVVVRPRHIEVQVFGDRHGNVVHLFERDCSLQRRNQKVIEEAPAPGMSGGLRARMCEAAVGLAKAVSYTGAGTVEFLVEGGTLDETARWYFIEMNTRLQVEHPVTEAITGLDLVEWQFRIAAGERLPQPQSAIAMHGHAVEVRVCAEDPAGGFMPSIGSIDRFETPTLAGLRVETGVETGSAVSPYYDSMIAKLIIHRADRATALTDLADATRRTVVAGPRTNQTFLARLLDDPRVQSGEMDTGLIGRDIDTFTARPAVGLALSLGMKTWLGQMASAGATSDPSRGSAWERRDAFQLGPERRQTIAVVVDDQPATIDVVLHRDGSVDVVGDQGDQGDRAAAITASSFACPEPDVLHIVVDGTQTSVRRPVYSTSDLDEAGASGIVRAPITGRVAKVFAVAGAAVVKGDKIAMVEAMKMEHIVTAAIDGLVESIAVAEGAQVKAGAPLAHIAAVSS